MEVPQGSILVSAIVRRFSRVPTYWSGIFLHTSKDRISDSTKKQHLSILCSLVEQHFLWIPRFAIPWTKHDHFAFVTCKDNFREIGLRGQNLQNFGLPTVVWKVISSLQNMLNVQNLQAQFPSLKIMCSHIFKKFLSPIGYSLEPISSWTLDMRIIWHSSRCVLVLYRGLDLRTRFARELMLVYRPEESTWYAIGRYLLCYQHI